MVKKAVLILVMLSVLCSVASGFILLSRRGTFRSGGYTDDMVLRLYAYGNLPNNQAWKDFDSGLAASLDGHANVQVSAPGLVLDGTGDKAYVPDDASLGIVTGDFTIVVWIKDNSSLDISYIIAQFSTYANRRFTIELSTNTTDILFTGDTSYTHTHSGSIRDGNWHFLAFRYDVGTTTMYSSVDGGAEANDTYVPYSNGSRPNTSVGASASTNNEFTGSIDDVRLYDADITAGNVTLIYNASRWLHSN